MKKETFKSEYYLKRGKYKFYKEDKVSVETIQGFYKDGVIETITEKGLYLNQPGRKVIYYSFDMLKDMKRIRED